MTNDELAEYINIKGSPGWREVVERISPQRRAVFAKMKELEDAVKRGERPTDILLDFARSDKRGRGRL